ncbi:hypothetical protein EE612_040488, partial [Oryza sativa]
GDEKKTDLLMRMPGATERLVLFEADMYDAATFEPAIAGCEFVFLIATPIHHTTEAAVDATRIILQQCERSRTVRRVIHTASVTAASPLREDGSGGYKDFIKLLSLGSVPLVHIDDVCDAHVFCMDQPSIAGRFLCAAGYPNMKDYIDRFAAKYPEIEIKLK